MATQTSPASKSRSQQLREQGNVHLKSVEEGMSFVIQRGRLDKALTCYLNASTCSVTEDDSTSAHKNIAVASWKLGVLHLLKNTEKNAQIVISDNFKRASVNFAKALSIGSCKSKEWNDSLIISMEDCFQAQLGWLYETEMTHRIGHLHEFLGYLPDCLLKINGYILLGQLTFKEGIRALDKGDPNECFRNMKECYFPIQEGRRCEAKFPEVMSEIDVLEEDVFLHTCLAESRMAMRTGDELLTIVLKEMENIDMNMLWEIIDWYQQAISLCRDKDTEQEAITYSRLGKVYDKVLKISYRALKSYKQAINLAEAMAPRCFDTEDWFKESQKFVTEFYRKLNRDEEDRAEREETLKELKGDLELLHEMSLKSVPSFLERLYSTWPPKEAMAKYDDTLPEKKQVLLALKHYHPDKQDKEIHGKSWYYLSEEITKLLNQKNDYLKGEMPFE